MFFNVEIFFSIIAQIQLYERSWVKTLEYRRSLIEQKCHFCLRLQGVSHGAHKIVANEENIANIKLTLGECKRSVSGLVFSFAERELIHLVFYCR